MCRVKLLFAVSAVAFCMASAVLASGPADPVPLTNWLLPAERPANGRVVPQGEQGRFLGVVADAVPSYPSTFNSVVPCRVVDTRNAPGTFGGPFFSANQTRTFTIPAGPCAGIPVAAAYSLNFTIVGYDVASNGFVTAYPSGSARPVVSTLNFGNGSNAVANAAIVPANAAGAIDVFISGATQLIIDINGYFLEGSGGTRTVFVNGTGTDTDNGTALVNALTAISGNSSTNRYLIKLDAGVFDVAANVLQMKPFVDIEGSGENATKIVSSVTTVAVTGGSVVASVDSELRSLTVENNGATGGNYGAAFYVPAATPATLTNVRLNSTGASFAIALANNGGTPVLRGCTLNATNSIATQNIGVYHLGGSASINETTISASGASAVSNRAVFNTGGTPSFRRCLFSVSSGGAGASTAIINGGTAGTLYIYNSTVVSTSSSIRNDVAWANRISNSQLNNAINATGGGTFICIASFNSAFTALSSGCL